MTNYQYIAQLLDANAITNVVDAYVKGRADAIEDCIMELAKMPDCKNPLLIKLDQMKEQAND